MAGNAYLTANVVVRADGREYELGTGDLPITIALTSPGGVDSRSYDVANGASQAIWVAAAATGTAQSFKFFGILPTKTVMLEIQGTTAADNGHLELLANVPWWIASDNTQAYNAAGGFAGAAQDIKQMLVKNSSGATALVRTLVLE